MALAASIKHFLNADKQDIENANFFKYEFITSERINKIEWEIPGDAEDITGNNLVDITDDYGPELLK